MKKVSVLVAVLFLSGAVFAGKKNKKGAAKACCNKEASACAKKSAGDVSTEGVKACCKKGADGTKACAKKEAAAASVKAEPVTR